MIFMEGKYFKKNVCMFCIDINVKCWLLLDRDVYIEIDIYDIIKKFKFMVEFYDKFVG